MYSQAFMEEPVIETPRLELRLPRDSDIPALIRFYEENQAHLAPWEPLRAPGWNTGEAWRDQVRYRRAELDAAQGVRFFIFSKEEAGRLVGNISLSRIQRFPGHSCNLGYGLAAWAQGRGYATEAVAAVVRFGFDTLRLHRIEAGYMPHNRRSAAVLRRAGFTVEGYARDYLLINGRWEDHVLTALTNPDWKE